MNRLAFAPRVAAACLALCAAPPSLAGTYRIDESGTVVTQPVVNLKWRQVVPGRGDDAMEGQVRVELRLNLQPWLNRPARIYLVLAPSASPVTARWSTQGRLLPGTVQSGQRALVYEGPAGPAVLAESLLLALEADGARALPLQQLNFHFEIEVAP
jgi:hypothetical protein